MNIDIKEEIINIRNELDSSPIGTRGDIVWNAKTSFTYMIKTFELSPTCKRVLIESIKALEQQQKEIKIRNEIIKEFCQNVEYETPQVNATFKKAIKLMNLHLVQS